MSRLLWKTLRSSAKLHSFNSFPSIAASELTNSSSIRSIQRWVAPTIAELNRRKRIYADKLPQVHKRSSFIDWNFKAEIYSYGKRLNENFDLALLERAFVQRSYAIQEELRWEKLGIEKDEMAIIQDNRELADKGLKLAKNYVDNFLRYHLPQYPDEGIAVLLNYLLSTEKLAYISQNLGSKEIILAAEYPPSEESLAQTLLAIIGALEESQIDGNLERPYNFVRDFICTHLNQVDINEVWKIENPFELLKQVCAQKNIKNIEPRIIGDLSKNDILSCCRIGLYDSDTKKLLGTGYGDTYHNGIETASIDALSKIFGTFNLKPFNYEITPAELFEAQQSKSRQIAN
ncbi:39S ribosomal protein L44, mitochondrial [Contarinia nasturtii]|uniref:39S ribosomal protein L44, mitochondrial n=1 Tax=Contarinia nasturtii TaxID=265458 RepID=UPI0012D3E649|nr:39S ribosomal protein L44, mitochondrial [Contarinia nasturtii]